MGSAYQFHSWRVFVVVCALPCVSAVVALTFMPESPRFYLEVSNCMTTSGNGCLKEDFVLCLSLKRNMLSFAVLDGET